MVSGFFRKIIWRHGYSKKFEGKEIFRICGAEESKYHTFRPFDHSFEELKYDTSIANLQGRELEIAAYNDPPFVYSNIDKIVKGVRAESSIDSKSKQIWEVSISK